jgi:hypothetical protein
MNIRAAAIKTALVVEVVLVVWASYVTYRWEFATDGKFGSLGQFGDLVPFYGPFQAVVAPWLFVAAVIPVCFMVLAAADRVIRKISN